MFQISTKLSRKTARPSRVQHREDIFLLFRSPWAPTSPEELTLELAEGFMEPGSRVRRKEERNRNERNNT